MADWIATPTRSTQLRLTNKQTEIEIVHSLGSLSFGFQLLFADDDMFAPNSQKMVSIIRPLDASILSTQLDKTHPISRKLQLLLFIIYYYYGYYIAILYLCHVHFSFNTRTQRLYITRLSGIWCVISEPINHFISIEYIKVLFFFHVLYSFLSPNVHIETKKNASNRTEKKTIISTFFINQFIVRVCVRT